MPKLLRKTAFLCGILLLCLGFTYTAQAQSPPKFKVIAFYSASFDVAHISFAHEACGWFAKMAQEYNFQFDSTKNWDNLNANFLSQYQVVMFLDDQPSSTAQRNAFQQYMQNGGGFIGFHVCAFNTDPASWDWYHNQFLATGSFKTNTWGPSAAVIKVEDNTHPATLGLPAKFTSAVSEWYGWTKDLRTNSNIRILCSIDPSSFPLGTDPNQSWYSGYYPVVWANKNYKMIYCNFGHNDIDYAHGNATKSYTFSNPTQNKIVIQQLLTFGSAATAAIPGTMQAEAYDVSFGIKKENCTDAGGGQNIGYIDANDWLDYKVNVQSSGTYKVEFRVASMNGGGSMLIKSGNTTLGAVNVAATNGWQTWNTVSTTVNLNAGTQTLRLQAVTGGFNVNWVKFTSTVLNTAPTVTLTAPTTNASYVAPASITLAADASDVDGSVTKVDFYEGSTLLGSDAIAPYSYTWSVTTAGNYNLKAVATDNNGAVKTSSLVKVTVTTPPVCLPAFASADDGNVAANVLDNNLNTRWSASGDGQWIQFCLNDVQDVSGVQIAFYNGNVRQSIFDVQTSLDGSNWTSALTNVRSSGTSLNLETFNFSIRQAKYVKITGHENSVNAWNSFTEVKITTGPVVQLPNQRPTVSISSPLNNASFTAPATLTVTATAADADGSITKVDFYEGTTLIGTDASAPYSISYGALSTGTYALSAIATDDSSAATSSATVSISVVAPVNKLPTVNITSPAANASFTAPASITINANAADTDGTISKVEFYNGSTLLGTDATAPYSYTWTNVAAANYTLTAKAFDNVSASTTSASVNIHVNPVVTNPCTGVAAYKENNGYVAGSIVQNAGARYQCKPWPASGWCNGAAWAYAPGTGSAWGDAWTKIGSCAAARTSSADGVEDANVLKNSSNPFVESTTIEVKMVEGSDVSLKVYDRMGNEVAVIYEGYLNEGTYSYVFTALQLKSDIYIVKLNTSYQVTTLKIIKSE